MAFLSEFKQFISRGNVIDLAVAVIIGAAFGKIITSLVDGIVMPLIGLLLGGINVTDKTFTIGQAAVKWGLFLQNVIDFIIIAFAIFVAIKFINMVKNNKEEDKPKLSTQEALLTEIRDLLKEKSKLN